MTQQTVQSILLAVSSLAALLTVAFAVWERRAQSAADVTRDAEERLGLVAERVADVATAALNALDVHPSDVEEERSIFAYRVSKRRLQAALSAYRASDGPPIETAFAVVNAQPRDALNAVDATLNEITRIGVRLLVVRPGHRHELERLIEDYPLMPRDSTTDLEDEPSSS